MPQPTLRKPFKEIIHAESKSSFFSKDNCNRRFSHGSTALQYSRVYGANEKLGIACVGTGGKGWSDLTGVAASSAVQVIALCDIDSSAAHLGQAADKYSAARRYEDWRKLLDEAKDIQGVIVSTPDFMHAPISLAAMHLGKHVFCQKRSPTLCSKRGRCN